MNRLRITGQAAEMWRVYHHAATLGAWSVDSQSGAWIFTATIVEKDDFQVSQRPLEVVTPNGWRWPVDTLQITDGTLVAVIRPKEPDHAVHGVCRP